MNNKTAMIKVKDLCEGLPTLSCDYTLKHELRCKGEEKPMAESEFDGFVELPIIAILIAAFALAFLMSAGTCMTAAICKRKCHRRHR